VGQNDANSIPKGHSFRVVQPLQVISRLLDDDGTFPNNGMLPLMVYARALDTPEDITAEAFETLFLTNAWGNAWRNGVYGFHHYHSTAHEVLGIYAGTAQVQFGGPKGVSLAVVPGDVVIIPAGVAHKNVDASGDFRCVGAYPRGQRWDMNYGKSGERPRADENIAAVATPCLDPVYGAGGPLLDRWHTRQTHSGSPWSGQSMAQ
jgi:uncharacterized protein YjlB